METPAPQALSFATAATDALIIAITAALALLAYAYRSNQKDFDIVCWFYSNTNRFLVGGIITVGFCSLTALVPDISPLLSFVGFNLSAKAPLSLGLALAVYLIGGVSGNKEG